MSKDAYFSTTPRQLGLDKPLEELYEAKKMLPELLQREWAIFPDKKILYQNLDNIPTPEDFEDYPRRKELEATSEDAALACVIYGAIMIAEARTVLTYNMIPLLEYAQRYNKPGVIVRQKCLRGNVIGAVNVGRDWMIPNDSPYMDFRAKEWESAKDTIEIKPNPTESIKNKGYYLAKTPRQIGYECTKEQLERDLRALVPERLHKRWKVFGSTKVMLKRLDKIQKPDDYVSIIEKKNLLNISALEMAIASTIHCALTVLDARTALFYNMMPLTEYAKMNGKNPDIVRQKCLRGNVEGATKVGSMWFIPKTTIYEGRKK